MSARVREPVTREELVEERDRAETDAERLVLAITQVLRDHDDCVCRHTKRLLRDAIPPYRPRFVPVRSGERSGEQRGEQ